MGWYETCSFLLMLQLQEHKQARPLKTNHSQTNLLGMLLRARVPAALIALLLLVLALPALLWLEIDLSFRPLFNEDPKLATISKGIEGSFGDLGSGSVGVLIQSDDVMNVISLETVRVLRNHLARVHGIKNLVDVTTQVSGGKGDNALVLERLCPEGPVSQSCVQNILRLEKMAPSLTRPFLAHDHRSMVLWLELEDSIFDLDKRRRVLREVQRIIDVHPTMFVNTSLVGYSVVEIEYEALLKKSAAQAAVFTFLCISILLFWVFREKRAVAIAFLGVTLGLPFTFAAMALLKMPITLVSASLPTLLLMVGVADSIHFLSAFQHRRSIGTGAKGALLATFSELLSPCVLTTITTTLGFASLLFAQLPIIRSFGLSAAIGVVIVHICNSTFIPLVLFYFPLSGRKVTNKPNAIESVLLRWSSLVVRRPVVIAIAGAIFVAGIGSFSFGLEAVQYFNKEVSQEHALRKDQVFVEKHHIGFLGPDVVISRKDRREIVDEDALLAIRKLSKALSEVHDVHRVLAPTDFLDGVDGFHGGGFPSLLWTSGLEQLLDAPGGETQVGRLIAKDKKRALLLVRTSDVGTKRALQLIASVKQAANESLSPDFVVDVGGHWVQAQTGMAHLVKDMLKSFLLALLMVLPFFVDCLKARASFPRRCVAKPCPHGLHAGRYGVARYRLAHRYLGHLCGCPWHCGRRHASPRDSVSAC
ncbi:MAG: MMPL family transporter [Deltaproteobacteria bacterium]|nr:MMPL family transporter [Deltaproteobacteria bacterium]